MIRKSVIYLFFVAILCPFFSQGQSRIIWALNDNWKYFPEGADFAQNPKSNDTKWETVNIPHTWNAKDPFDDDETSRRGISWYRKKIVLDKRFKNKQVFVNFEGVGQIADVYVNGVFAGQHKGGFTGFTFDITHLVKLNDMPTENLIAVQVNNAHNDFIPPLSIGYAYYGGIYRDVWLIATDKVHFDLSDHGSKGVFISTPKVSKQKADVKIKTNLTNDAPVSQEVLLTHVIYKDKAEIKKISKSQKLDAGVTVSLALDIKDIENPILWSPDHPFLYQVKSEISINGKVVDEQFNNLGFRWFSFDAQQGFSLNGKKLILKGTNRHQDFKDKGDALSSEDHYRDLKLIKDMGCNFLRMAHYPQAPEVLAIADKIGLLVWEEIPLVNYMNPVPEFLANSTQMIKEMIRQNYNHPSIIIWGSMNEVLLWSDKAERIQVQDNLAYLAKVREYAILLDQVVRKEDPSRISTMAMHISDDYDKYKLLDISQLASFNIYDGWYSGVPEEFKSTIDAIHKKYPKQPIFISEYGAEADNRVNSERPVRFDFTGQYQRYYHETYLRQINQMPYLSGTAIWNQFDFSQPNVGGVSNNMNQKGMVTWDRKPKDSYYLYKANWNSTPMVYIASRDWRIRTGVKGKESTIEVYTNAEEVSLVINGKSYGSQKPNDIKKAVWKVLLQEGENNVVATGTNGAVDFLKVTYKTYEEELKNIVSFRELAVNAGSDAQYIDPSEHVWIEDRPYKEGSFGHIGGTFCTLNIKTVKKGTNDKPLFYYYLKDLKGYRFDVSDGTYELELNFIEPEKLEKDERIFDVVVNGNIILPNFNLNDTYGFAVAVKKKFVIKAENDKGIYVELRSIKGSTVISGIKIKKIN